MAVLVPDSHIDLIEGPVSAVLSTVMPDGQPQSTVIWCNYDGTYVLITTISTFQKARNMRAHPKVTLFVYRRNNPLRFIEIRGTVVEMTEEGAMEHLDQLAELYTGKSPYYGEVQPIEWKDRETPVLCKIAPTHIVTMDGSSK
jgi:PPOX class probable F420-dependent enzyme